MHFGSPRKSQSTTGMHMYMYVCMREIYSSPSDALRISILVQNKKPKLRQKVKQGKYTSKI